MASSLNNSISYCCRLYKTDHMWSLNPLVRRNADARPSGSGAQHSVSAVDFVRDKNTLIVAACEELVNNGGVS